MIVYYICLCCFFFFKQKTAYEMRISDCSSDVCSSDLIAALKPQATGRLIVRFGAGGDRDVGKRETMGRVAAAHADLVIVTDDNPRTEPPAAIRADILKGAPGAIEKIGRAHV